MINYTSHNLKALFKAIATHLVISVQRIKDIGLLLKRYSVHARISSLSKDLVDTNIIPKVNVSAITPLEFGKTSKERFLKYPLKDCFLFFFF